VRLSDRTTWIEENKVPGTFDCYGNGPIDFAAVTWLFNNL